uniref:YjcQ protein n=1 Tax=Siphoviridae sp. ctQWe10 TaxID=2827867 RepID=A0A8S5TBL5_9CAUD|nr:MAG TPA: YjcQ protein [Siphoviridae sp. ctQWe10]
MEREIYKVLSLLKYCYEKNKKIEEEIDYQELDLITMLKTFKYLQEEELVTGLKLKLFLGNKCDYDLNNLRITLKGLEYLKENKMMNKIKKELMDIATIVK